MRGYWQRSQNSDFDFSEASWFQEIAQIKYEPEMNKNIRFGSAIVSHIRDNLKFVWGFKAMIKRILASAGLLFAVSGLSLSGAHAGVAGAVSAVDIGQTGASIIKVHSARQVHDKLHRKGYYKVRYVDRFYGRYEKPVYKFRACRRGIKYKILVDWYGDIIKRKDIGDCSYRRHRHYGDDGYRRYKHGSHPHKHKHRRYDNEGSSYHRGYKD